MSGVRIAVVGLGGRGTTVAAALARLGVLGPLCDVVPEVLLEVGAQHPEVRKFADYLEILATPTVTAVALCSPPGTWDGMVEAALRAGKDVYLDGPLVLPLARGKALLELAAEGRRLVMGGPVTRFAPAAETFLGCLRAGGLGTLRYVHGRHFKAERPGPEALPEAGVSPVLAQLLLDVLEAAPVKRLTVRAATWRSATQPDVTEVSFDCHTGTRGLLHTSHVEPRGAFELTAIGTEGAATLRRDETDRLVLDLVVPGADTPPPSSAGEAREASLAHFLDAVRTRRPPLQGPDALLALWRFLAAAQRSLDEGGAVDPADTGPVTKSAPPAGVYLHPTVQVDGPCDIGPGTKIWHFSKLLGPLKIGRDCSFGQNVVIERGVAIGDNVKVQNNVSIYAGVILEDDVFCGPSMVFTNIGTPRSHYPRKGQYAVTRVRRGASIGANATVVCGHTLGQYCFVGAGAVVTRDVPDFALVYGNPARVMGFACYCGVRLPFGTAKGECQEAACPECGRRYTREGHEVVMLADA